MKSTKPNYVVVGSGPSGVISSLALLRNGGNVTMLDIGNDLPKTLSMVVDALAKTEPNTWSKFDIAFLRNSFALTKNNVPEKTVFGSRFPYDDSNSIIGSVGLPPAGFSQFSSSSYGGFSRVWGAAVMRLHPADIHSWPIKGLDHYYDVVERLLPISGNNDGLTNYFNFPLNATPAKTSNQARIFLKTLSEHRAELDSLGVSFGASRLAVHESCKLCANCLHGCPYEKIFSSTDLMGLLHKFPGFAYQNKSRVIEFQENDNFVKVTYLNDHNSINTLEATRVFLGSGVLSTAKIILDSLHIENKSISLMDSQYFLIPFLGPGYKDSEGIQTLAQAFVEINNNDISKHNVHSQIYTFNDLYEREIRSALGFISRFPPVNYLSKGISKRLYLAQSYLHSDQSLGAKLKLVKNGQHNSLEIIPNPPNVLMKLAIKKVWSLLKVVGAYGGIYALPMLGKIANIGQGYHSGGTFPISLEPKVFESDILGRPLSLKRVHIVDSSVLPSIPSGTITLTVMANAYRIAEQSAKIDSPN